MWAGRTTVRCLRSGTTSGSRALRTRRRTGDGQDLREEQPRPEVPCRRRQGSDEPLSFQPLFSLSGGEARPCLADADETEPAGPSTQRHVKAQDLRRDVLSGGPRSTASLARRSAISSGTALGRRRLGSARGSTYLAATLPRGMPRSVASTPCPSAPGTYPVALASRCRARARALLRRLRASRPT